MAERRILVVDDDKMIHTVVRAAIEKHGYKVFSGFDTMQVPMMARQLKPDLIVLDINMPGGGGFEAFRRLQMMSWTAQIPVRQGLRNRRVAAIGEFPRGTWPQP